MTEQEIEELSSQLEDYIFVTVPADPADFQAVLQMLIARLEAHYDCALEGAKAGEELK